MSFCKKLHPSERGLEAWKLRKNIHLNFPGTLPSSCVSCCLFPLKVGTSGSLAHAGSFSKAPFTSGPKGFVYFFCPHLALSASFTGWSGAQRPLGSVKIATHLFSFVVLQPRRKKKKRMMTWKSWKLGQEPCNHSSTWLEKRLWLPILGANVFCWGESISKMSLSLILTQSSGNCIAVFCIAWSAQRREGGAGGIACCRYGWISVEKVFAKSNTQLLDCAPATAGSSSSIWAIYWIEISWKNTL